MALRSKTTEAIKSIALAIVAAWIAAQPYEAAGSDLEMLARVLIPAYMADDFAALCRAQEPAYLNEGIDGFRTTREYAEHVKREVTQDIPEDDAARVRLTAANVALQIARNELHALGSGEDAKSRANVQAWCEGSAKSFILYLIAAHRSEHAKFDSIVENAKRR